MDNPSPAFIEILNKLKDVINSNKYTETVRVLKQDHNDFMSAVLESPDFD